MEELISKLPSNMQLTYVPLLFFSMFIHYLLEPLRWYFYIGKVYKLNYKRMFSIFSLTALVSYLLPMKMGLPIRIFLLRTKAGMSFIQSSSILIVDGLINYSCWGIATTISLVLLIKHDLFKINFVFIVVVLIAVLTIYFIWKKSRAVIPINVNINTEKIGNKKNSIRHLISNLNLSTILKSMLVMPIDIGSHVVHHWAIFSMLGINLEWSAVFTITTVSIFTGLISMMPMGLGGYDAMLILLLTQYSIAPEHAISIAIINRLTSFCISIFTGIYGGVKLELNPFKTQWRKLIPINYKKA